MKGSLSQGSGRRHGWGLGLEHLCLRVFIGCLLSLLSAPTDSSLFFFLIILFFCFPLWPAATWTKVPLQIQLVLDFKLLQMFLVFGLGGVSQL